MTSNEVEQTQSGTLEIFPPSQAPASAATAMLMEHAQNMQTAYHLAKQLVRTTIVPKRYLGKPDDATAAILYGAELGLNPIQSLQRVIPIHGMPTLEARTMVGLLKSKGYAFRVRRQSDALVEIWAWEPDSPKIYGTDPDNELDYQQRIRPDAESCWTIERATQAGYVPTPSSPDSLRRPNVDEDWVTVTKYWDNKPKVSVVGNMKYITDPQTMLKAKGYAETSRELAPDVLMGISYTREEVESEDQRQFDRDDRPAAPSRATSSRVTEDEIFAEEVPLSKESPIETANPPTADEVRAANQPYVDAAASAATAFPESPAGDVTEDQGAAAPDPQPSPAEQPETVPAPAADPEPATTTDTEAAKTSKKVAAKRSTARSANPDKPRTRMRQALEKRLFGLLGDAGLSGDQDRDGRIAVYRAVLENESISSTDDLDDPAVGRVADQLYSWQQQGALDDEVGAILAEAARDAEETAAATAAEPTTEGNDQ